MLHASGGSGQNLRFSIMVAGSTRQFFGDDRIHFIDQSELLNVTGCEDEPQGQETFGCPTAGNVTITLTGVKFVPPAFILVGPYACGEVDLIDPTKMTCLLPAGVGSHLAITGTAATKPIVSTLSLSYGRPQITSLLSPVCDNDPSSLLFLLACSRQGGSLTMIGVNFGGSTTAQVLVGGKFCSVTKQTNTRIECNIGGGSGKFVAITIIQGGQTSNPGPMISFDDCPLGSVGDASGSSSCESCEPGTYAEIRGQPTCSSCARGLYSNITSASTCERCYPGTITPRQGATVCENCNVGHYVESFGQSQCLPCWTGSANGAEGRSLCDYCEAGRFAGYAAQTTCDNCLVGEYTDAIGQDYCKQCARGQYGNYTGATKCHDCDVGQYASQLGQTSCDGCAGRRYQPLQGQTFCYSCLGSEYLVNPSNNRPCAPCPTGADCMDDGGIVAKAGYFVIADNGAASSYACLPKACLGGSQCTANMSVTALSLHGTYVQSCCSDNRQNATDNLLW
jgi:hypothetical protein